MSRLVKVNESYKHFFQKMVSSFKGLLKKTQNDTPQQYYHLHQ